MSSTAYTNGKEDAARMCDALASSPSRIRLHAGEMSAQEMRTAQAVLRLAAALIRQSSAIDEIAAEARRLDLT